MGENCIKFNICGQKRNTINYSMNKTSKMLKMKLYYSERVEIPVKNLQFTFKQICIGAEKTPEVLGMKNGDTVNVSFTDEDCYLMEFGPRHIKDRGRGKISYEATLQLAEFTGKLLDVWKKRVVGAREGGTLEMKNFVPFHGLEMNFYQMSPKSREKLIKYSVEKLLDIFESEEEIERFEDCIFKVEKFTKMCIFNILENSLPIPLPYPVLRIITGHLLAVKGLDQIGQVTEQKMERKCMEKLYYCLADIYKHLKVLMFNTDRQWHNGSPLYTLAVQKREDLLSRLQVLSDLMVKLVDGSKKSREGPSQVTIQTPATVAPSKPNPSPKPTKPKTPSNSTNQSQSTKLAPSDQSDKSTTSNSGQTFYLCPVENCSFFTTKQGMQEGTAANHLNKTHKITGANMKSAAPGTYKFTKVKGEPRA